MPAAPEPEAILGPKVSTVVDPMTLSAEEKARLRTKVRIVVACFSALVLLITYLVLLAIRG